MAADPKRSIRPWIPQTAQNDPDKFPPYEYTPYPRMMTKLCTEADLKDWMEHNSYITDNGKTAYKGSRWVVGSPIPILDAARKPVIVQNAAEEAAFLKANPSAPQIVQIEVPALSKVTHTAEMAAAQAEIDDLKRQLAEKSKRGRPPGQKAAADMPSNLPPG